MNNRAFNIIFQSLIESFGKPAKRRKSLSEEDEEEPIVVKRIIYEGVSYLQCKKKGIIYDYNGFLKDKKIRVGIWNDETKKIDFDIKCNDSA